MAGTGHSGESEFTQDTAALAQLTSETLCIRKRDPWSSVIPPDLLVLLQFEATATTPKIPFYKLITVGKQLLNYIIDAQIIRNTMTAVGPQSTTASNSSRQRQTGIDNIPKAIEIFNNVFQRIIDIYSSETNSDTGDGIAPEDHKNMEDFCNEIWKSYSEGTVDFTHDSLIISNIHQIFPKYLENILEDAIKTDDLECLVTLCLDKNELGAQKCFRQTLFYLSHIFECTKHHSGVMDFTKKFLGIIEQKTSPSQLVQLYPVEFQPILCLLHSSIQIQQELKSSVELQDQLLHLINELYEEFDMNGDALHQNKDLVNFYIASNPILVGIIRNGILLGGIKFTKYPFLWKFLYLKN